VTDEEVAALSRQIAAFERVSPDQIVLGDVLAPLGVHLAKDRAVKQGAGGTILYSSPGYTELIDAAAPLGGVGMPIPLDARLANDLPAFERAIDARTIAVSLVNPHNPSGTVDDRLALDGFLRRASRRVPIIVDEAYLEYDDLPGRTAVRLIREGANVIVFRTFAKIHGLASLAFGYAVASPALAANLRRAGIGDPHTLSRLALVSAGAALADMAHVNSVRSRVSAERERVTRKLDELGLTHSDSRASFVFWKSPLPASTVRATFRSRGIEIARAFAPLDEWVRVTIGLPAENDAVIAALGDIYGNRRT
jgi:histidinol-phosphate aminotransferase